MQVVGYETSATGETDTPALQIAADGRVERKSLASGTELAYTLGTRHCAGVVDGSSHDACERASSPYCDRHASRWACARCTGDCDLPLASCREEHAVYLAAFAPATFKVGVTRSWRLETRLREQGADRGAHLQTVQNGRIARQIEADIAADVGDRVRVRTKMQGLHESVDTAAWGSLRDSFDPLATYSFDYQIGLSDRPVRETLLTGTVRGTQGRVLVLDTNGTTYAVDMRELVGYELRPHRTDRQLQSNLDAFG